MHLMLIRVRWPQRQESFRLIIPGMPTHTHGFKKEFPYQHVAALSFLVVCPPLYIGKNQMKMLWQLTIYSSLFFFLAEYFIGESITFVCSVKENICVVGGRRQYISYIIGNFAMIDVFETNRTGSHVCRSLRCIRFPFHESSMENHNF